MQKFRTEPTILPRNHARLQHFCLMIARSRLKLHVLHRSSIFPNLLPSNLWQNLYRASPRRRRRRSHSIMTVQQNNPNIVDQSYYIIIIAESNMRAHTLRQSCPIMLHCSLRLLSRQPAAKSSRGRKAPNEGVPRRLCHPPTPALHSEF